MVGAAPRSVGPTPPESEPAMNRRIPVLATALSTTYDYEGTQVAYSTPHHIESLLLSSTGELLDSASEDIVTPARP
jgi:hypothetical protein